MKQPGDQLSLVLPAEGLCGVLLFNVAPSISAMLMEWLALEAYVPIELTETAEAVQWLVDSNSGLSERAALFDLSTQIDPAFLRQTHDLAAVTIGISGYPTRGVTRYYLGEWIDAILPRPFRVRNLLAILDEHLRWNDESRGSMYEQGRRLR